MPSTNPTPITGSPQQVYSCKAAPAQNHESSVSLRGSWSELKSSSPRSADWRTLPRAHQSRGNPRFRRRETLPRVLARAGREPVRRQRKPYAPFRLLARPKCVQFQPLLDVLGGSPPRLNALIRRPITGVGRLDSVNSLALSDEIGIDACHAGRTGRQANQRPWRRESDRRGRNRTERLGPM
jgi:hypothetical protein